MTPSEIELMCRRKYNSVNDSFWSEQEIFDLIYAAELELCDEGYVAERVYSTSTVIGTQEYDYPDYALAIKRVTWDGKKLTRIDMIEDDLVTGLNQTTTDTGNPEFYWIWNNVISLRPVPSSVATLKIWTYNQPSTISSGSQTLEVPTQYHARICNFVLSQMAAKDSNYNAATYYLNIWNADKIKIKQSMRKSKRTDKFTSVKDEQMQVETQIGGL
jgi:hypothetical protein